ncbi:helix-turn-helix transcriptional regulator [Nostocales cyanobacterium LEGE 11386]|jgi:transcriptional regulator with XRE-family HTH domain|nr:helix-turn-helix transcriptional regulator [Nostocales cyanobacterium LEGE 11386]MBW4558782.1 helix-turn-helix domain-containing protein [Trichormus sp. ATA11-4-KO1]
MQVKRTITVVKDFPGLGERIKKIREGDSRSLSQICRDSGISRSYWHQIENEDLRAAVTEDIIRKIEAILNTDLGVSFD